MSPKQRKTLTRNTKEDMWEVMRQLRTFTFSDIINEIHLSRIVIRNYINGLVKAGILAAEEIDEGPRDEAHRFQPLYRYKIIKDREDAPVLTKYGTEDQRVKARQQIWRTIRIFKRFDLTTLWAGCGTDELQPSRAEVLSYLRFLTNAGILRKKGGRADRADYILVKNPGPKTPIIRVVWYLWDPNTKEAIEAGRAKEDE